MWSWLPDKSEVSYKVFIHMVQEALIKRNIKFNIIISDFEINILKSTDQLIADVKILRCYFHLSKNFWKRVQMMSMVKEYDENEQFINFVKSATALAHLPLSELNWTMD